MARVRWQHPLWLFTNHEDNPVKKNFNYYEMSAEPEDYLVVNTAACNNAVFAKYRWCQIIGPQAAAQLICRCICSGDGADSGQNPIMFELG